MKQSLDGADTSLIRFLAQRGWVSREDAEAIAEDARTRGFEDSVIELLGRRGVVGEAQLAGLLSSSLNLPYVDLAAEALDPSVAGLVKEELAMKALAVPLAERDGVLEVAVANPFDRDNIRAIEFATGRRVKIRLATLTAVRDALKHLYHLDESLDAYLQGVAPDAEVPVADLAEEPEDLNSLARSTSLPPVVKLLNVILLDGIRAGASDIHIEPAASAVLVRQRIDGLLEESFRLPKWVHNPLVARCKVLAKLDITERRIPQDGRIRLRYREGQIDLRVSSLPTQHGEKITLRILNAAAAPKDLASLGFADRDLQAVRSAIRRPEGMILVTGPTGSGKTTTLYGMIAELASPTRNIITIEDPIEYEMRGINQVEISEKQGRTFAATLRSILRQDPDVILVGEIRDTETAEIALRAAQTGHLVLSTLHTNDAVSTVTRLLDLGIEPYLLASSLNLVVAQRLVRRTCRSCAQPYDPDPEARRALHLEEGEARFVRGVGCSACRKTGYAGRVPVFEVLVNTPAVARLIETRAPESRIRLQARKDGMRSMAECAAELVRQGVVTPEEVLRAVDVLDAGAACPACHRAVDESFAACPYCGATLRRNCGACDKPLEPEWRVCPHCGWRGKGADGDGAQAIAGVEERPVARDSLRALVVDDQEDMRNLVAYTLRKSGLPLTVETAASGREALEKAALGPDLIVLDVMMPDMDGFEVCRRLRADVRTAFIPILMLTALDDTAHRAQGFLAGTDDYIGKPFDRSEFLARVHRLIQRTYGNVVPAVGSPDAAGIAPAVLH